MSFVPKKIVNEVEVLSEYHINKATAFSNGLCSTFDVDRVSCHTVMLEWYKKDNYYLHRNNCWWNDVN